MSINYFYFMILLFSIYIQFYYHVYDYVDYTNWTSMIENKQIFLL